MGRQGKNRDVKATLFFPAHPAYFDDEYTQEEIDKATEQMKELGYFPELQPHKGVLKEIVFLREPGAVPTHKFDSADFAVSPGPARDAEINRFNKLAAEALQSRINTLKVFMQINRETI